MGISKVWILTRTSLSPSSLLLLGMLCCTSWGKFPTTFECNIKLLIVKQPWDFLNWLSHLFVHTVQFTALLKAEQRRCSIIKGINCSIWGCSCFQYLPLKLSSNCMLEGHIFSFNRPAGCFQTNENSPNQHCLIKTSKREVRGNVPVRPSVTGYENLCKKWNINCVSGGEEIKKVMREPPDTF